MYASLGDNFTIDTTIQMTDENEKQANAVSGSHSSPSSGFTVLPLMET